VGAHRTLALAPGFPVLAPAHRDSGENPPEPDGAAYRAGAPAGDAVARLYAHAGKRTRGAAFRQLGDYYRDEAGGGSGDGAGDGFGASPESGGGTHPEPPAGG
jgi:hypothetical protein